MRAKMLLTTQRQEKRFIFATIFRLDESAVIMSLFFSYFPVNAPDVDSCRDYPYTF